MGTGTSWKRGAQAQTAWELQQCDEGQNSLGAGVKALMYIIGLVIQELDGHCLR